MSFSKSNYDIFQTNDVIVVYINHFNLKSFIDFVIEQIVQNVVGLAIITLANDWTSDKAWKVPVNDITILFSVFPFISSFSIVQSVYNFWEI